MLGACAAFASYLSRKHREQSQKSEQVTYGRLTPARLAAEP